MKVTFIYSTYRFNVLLDLKKIHSFIKALQRLNKKHVQNEGLTWPLYKRSQDSYISMHGIIGTHMFTRPYCDPAVLSPKSPYPVSTNIFEYCNEICQAVRKERDETSESTVSTLANPPDPPNCLLHSTSLLFNSLSLYFV